MWEIMEYEGSLGVLVPKVIVVLTKFSVFLHRKAAPSSSPQLFFI